MDQQAWVNLLGIVVSVLTLVIGAMAGWVLSLALKVNTLENEHKHWKEGMEELKRFLHSKGSGTP